MSEVDTVTASTTEPVVQFVDVTHRYGEVLAANNLSLTIPAGKTVGFIGPDGVGKSTWLGLIAGARQIQQGQVRVLGGDMLAHVTATTVHVIKNVLSSQLLRIRK